MVISKNVEKLVEAYRAWQLEGVTHEDEGVISVDEVIARVASFYEKIRGIVDWREEHLLRKTAIERILKRRLAIRRIDENFAESFLSELVRGGHFPNNRISFTKVDEVQDIVQKYIAIIEQARAATGTKNKNTEDWLFSVAAVEVEEALSLPIRERALIELMTDELVERTQVGMRKKQEVKLGESDKILQTFVAVQRALYKLDDATISYHILEKFYEDWKSPAEETLTYVGDNLEALYANIQGILTHPYAENFYQLAEKYDTPYLILGDILTEEVDRFKELTENQAELEAAILRAYNARLYKLKGKIRRAAFYSTLSVFLTKVVAALSVEIPFERYFGGDLNYVALGVNVAIPPILMLALVATAQTTSKQNFDRVMIEVMKIIQIHDRPDVYKVYPPSKKGKYVVGSVYVLYLFSFLLSFGVLVWLLERLNFPAFSILVFLMFISLVLFGGTRIRQRARELMVEPNKEGFLYNVFDIFSLPMIQVGRWLSGQLSRYNILILVLNFLIEVPFQMFVEFLEQWRNFLREKKEKIH